MTQECRACTVPAWLLCAAIYLSGSALANETPAQVPTKVPTEVPTEAPTEQVDGVEMPVLGNTSEHDRQLSLEVPDTLIFEPATPSADSADKPQPDTADLSVWQLIRTSEPIAFENNDAISAQRKQYVSDAWWVSKTLARGTPYLAYIVSKLNERSLPLDLALIPAVESGYDPYARSSLAALGLWQIVPITAKEIGLKRTTWFDERGDLELSTRAALDYLSYLHAEFNGDWLLTLAAYNAGPGRVKAALRKNRKAGKALDYWSLSLPPETRAYVPKILALAALIRQQPESPLKLPEIKPATSYQTIDVKSRISLDKVALLADVKERDIRNLNAGLVHAVTPPKGPHKIRIPVTAAARFKRKLAETEDISSLYSLPRLHVVEAGESISTIARRYGISQRQLKDLNGLDGSKILIGQKLAVRDNRHQGSQKSITTLSYTIRRGDTLSEIAERFNVRMADITFASGATARNKVLIPGQKLTIQIYDAQERG